MTRGRLLALLLLLALLSTLLLTQTWFSIAMLLNGTPTTLGEFDGATTFSVAMPVNLLMLAIIGVAQLSKGITARILLALLALVGLGDGFWLSMQVFAKNVSGLDSQLERLTGIAKTHGISDLQIATTTNPWIWLAVTILLSLVAGYGVSVNGIWLAKQTSSKSAKPRTAKSDPISLWEDQRG